VVGKADDPLLFGFVTDLRSAEDDFDVRPDPFDGANDFSRRNDIPDVDAKADDFRVPGQEDFRNIRRTLVDIEFHEARAWLQVTKVGQQIAQAERGMDIFRIKRG
jgi:hypothetical protein